MKAAYFISLSHFIPPFGGTYTFSIYIPGTEGFVPTIGVLLVLVVCVCVWPTIASNFLQRALMYLYILSIFHRCL